MRPTNEKAEERRSPLNSLRESIRVVQQQELGPLNAAQQDMLAVALEKCDGLDQIVGDILPLERLSTALPPIARHWFWPLNVRSAVEQTIQPHTEQHDITVLWDIADETAVMTFGDDKLVTRLVSDLAINALQSTAAGQAILIRLEPISGGEAIRWTIVDQGPGIGAQQMRHASPSQPDSDPIPPDLRLALGRQLAALHFSTLRVRSRTGSGTAISFETPASGPTSVATLWSQWRIAQRAFRSSQTKVAGNANAADFSESQRLVQRRVDPPSVAIELHHEAAAPHDFGRIAVGTVTMGATQQRWAADYFDRVLQQQLSMFELVYRVDARRWIWIFDTPIAQVDQRFKTITNAAASEINNLRLNWGDTRSISVDERTKYRLSDLLVRATLASRHHVSIPDPERDQVQPDTRAFHRSQVAERRLKQEMHRLMESLAPRK